LAALWEHIEDMKLIVSLGKSVRAFEMFNPHRVIVNQQVALADPKPSGNAKRLLARLLERPRQGEEKAR